MVIKIKFILKKILYQLLLTTILVGIALLVSLLISHLLHISIQKILSYEGVIFFLIGILLSPSGNHSNFNLQGLGQQDVSIFKLTELETTRIEQEIKRKFSDYYKNFFKFNVIKVLISNITFLLVGTILLVLSFNI